MSDWWRPAAMLLAHAQPAALAAAVTTGTARHLADTPAPALAFAHGCALAATLLTLVADHYHEHRLCHRCAAATPTDGSAAAQRHHRWLRLHHWAFERIVFALALFAAAAAAYSGLGLWWIITYPVYALWAMVAYAGLRHRPVEPWCPHCRGWGWGEDGETDPVPPPVPAAGATQ